MFSICISLKQILSSGQKPVCTVKILISEQISFPAVVYFVQVFLFCWLIYKYVFDWLQLISVNNVLWPAHELPNTDLYSDTDSEKLYIILSNHKIPLIAIKLPQRVANNQFIGQKINFKKLPLRR